MHVHCTCTHAVGKLKRLKTFALQIIYLLSCLIFLTLVGSAKGKDIYQNNLIVVRKLYFNPGHIKGARELDHKHVKLENQYLECTEGYEEHAEKKISPCPQWCGSESAWGKFRSNLKSR